MRCGSCNEVFDGNAALLEPLASPPPASAPATAVAVPSAFDTSAPDFSSPLPSPEPAPFDENVVAQDGYADDALNSEPIYTLELDTALDQADDGPLAEPEAEAADDVAAIDAAQSDAYAADMTAPAREPEQVQHYWQQVEPELEPEPELSQEPGFESKPDPEVEPDTGRDPEPELDTWQTAARQTATEPHPESIDDSAATSGNPLDIKPMTHEELEAALAAELALMEQSVVADAVASDAPSTPSTTSAERREPTLDPESHYDLDEADEEALVQLAAARERDTAPDTHTLLRAASAPSQDRFEPPAEIHSVREPEPVAKQAEPEDPNEPGFVKRDRRRERYGKTTTIAMGVGALLLVGALALQGMTTFRNQLAASYPALKPTLQNICGAFGCKVELPTEIDELVIEQGELQTLSDTTFSFTTLLRNQSATAQTWPHIELVLDDANDKAILRRVFTPRDYLGPGAALEKGFAPRSEQSVKLYFELKQLKASGYHIAVFYP